MPIGLGTAAVIGGGLAAAGTVAAGALNSNAANKATNTQSAEFNQTTANNKPFLTTGTSALNQLGSIYGLSTVDPTTGAVTAGSAQPKLDPNATFYQSPDYQFDLSQGIKGVDAGAAAGGELDSGATRKAEIAYAGNLASGQFNTYANRLQSLAGVGQSAANSQANAGSNYASNIGAIAANSAANTSNAIGAGTSNINSILGNLTAQSANKSSYIPTTVPITPQNPGTF